MTGVKSIAVVIGCLASFAACGGAMTSAGKTKAQSVTCTPTTVPTPWAAWLNYPPNGSTGVSTSIGKIIEQGADTPPAFALPITVSSNGAPVALGAPTIAPSPFPAPFSTAPPNYGVSSLPSVLIPLPTLAPNTTYTVVQSYVGWSDTPPQCTATITQPVGSFTTGN